MLKSSEAKQKMPELYTIYPCHALEPVSDRWETSVTPTRPKGTNLHSSLDRFGPHALPLHIPQTQGVIQHTASNNYEI